MSDKKMHLLFVPQRERRKLTASILKGALRAVDELLLYEGEPTIWCSDDDEWSGDYVYGECKRVAAEIRRRCVDIE